MEQQYGTFFLEDDAHHTSTGMTVTMTDLIWLFDLQRAQVKTEPGVSFVGFGNYLIEPKPSVSIHQLSQQHDSQDPCQ